MKTFPCNFCPEKIQADFLVPGTNVTCPACGMESTVPARAPVATPANIQICPTCQASVSRNAVACPKCGHAFRQAGAINLSDPVHIAGLIVCAIIGVIVVLTIIIRTVGWPF